MITQVGVSEMKVFGLTGGIASGKSTVSRLWAKWGVPIVDADLVSREVMVPGTPAFTAIIECFGLGVLSPDGTLDRKAIGDVVFNDKKKRALLNSIVHPRIAAGTMSLFSDMKLKGEKFACYDAPLLIESGQAGAFKPIVVVTVPPDVQLSRIMARDGITEQAAKSRISAQMIQSAKIKQADVVINNDDDLSMLMFRSREALDKVKQILMIP
jgi:dephospho-CoA kinase